MFGGDPGEAQFPTLRFVITPMARRISQGYMWARQCSGWYTWKNGWALNDKTSKERSNMAIMTIKVPDETEKAYESASRYQREMAIQKFTETLQTLEELLCLENNDIDAMFEAIDRRHQEQNTPPIENKEAIIAEYRAANRKRIADMGMEAYIKELESYEDEEDGC